MKTKKLRWLAAIFLLVAAMVMPARGNAQVTLTYLSGSKGFDNETADNLFDGDTLTKWCYNVPSASSPAYVVFKASEPCRLNGYTITTANDNATETKRNPKNWNIYGSNDQSTWTKLVSVANDTILKDVNFTAYEYTLNVGIATRYEYYKWEITANKGANVFQVSEFSISVSNCTDASHEVALSLVKQKEATCTTDGYTRDFYRCSSCGRCYSDAAGETEIDLASVTITAEGHKFDGENGDCSVCGISHMFSYAGTAADPFRISTADDLYWFSAWVNGTYTPEEGKTAETHLDAYAVLTNDITANTGVLNADGTLASDVSGFTAWTPIGNSSNKYIGLFDGQNHTVSGLYFNNSQDYVGLFGYVGQNGKISNVGVVDSYIKGNNYVGGVCGYGNYATINNCYNTGAVSGSSSYVGGVCGYKYDGTISNCYNTGAVSGNSNRVGGVCGYSGYGAISNCYNTGAVSGSSSVGGVYGYGYFGTISNCYNTGAVSGSSSVGGVCGYGYYGTITNCYFDSIVYSGNAVGTNNGTVSSSNVLGKTSEQFKSGEVCYLLNKGKTDGTQAWYQDLTPETGDKSPVLKSNDSNTVYAGIPCMSQFSNTELASIEHSCDEHGFCTKCGGYQPATLTTDKYDINGDGTKDEVYEIGNAGQLYWFAALVNGILIDGTAQNPTAKAVLTADITVNTGVLNADGTLASDVSSFRNWTPIGNASDSYKGIFDGQNHIVSGLYLNDSQTNYVGLFGYVGNGGKISNAGVVDSYIEGNSYVGGVCGYGNYATINNCYNTGAVSGSNNIGGVCGYKYYGTISNCYNTGAVSGSSYVGGVCGYGYYGTITNCYFDSTVYRGNAVGYKNGGTVSSNVLGKTSEQFKSGEVCYLLNKGKTDGTQAWYQDLTPETGDKSPVLKSNGSNTVYAGIPCMSQFSNTGAASIEHSFDEHGFCTKCGGYQPATLTTDKYDIDGDGTKDEVYEIGNAGQLYWFAALVNGTLIDGTAQNRTAKAVLTADITVNTGVLNADGTLASDVSSFRSWTPIGNASGRYAGTFDGQSHTVSGLYLNDSQTNYVGLFGYVDSGGKISNVGVVDSYIKGNSYVGGVCGYGNYATINNCYNTGAVSGSNNIGGVCGYKYYGTISNCYNTGAVSGSSYVGGVCGYGYYGTITNCYFDSTVYSGNAVGTNNGTVSENVLGKTSEQFKSGEVAYLLSQGCIVGEGESAVTYDGSVWGQTLSGTGKQDYPVLGGWPVYYRDEVYTNTYGILTVGTQTITASIPITWYEFTPEADGTYLFVAPANQAWVRVDISIDEKGSPCYTKDLLKDTTYYVCIPGASTPQADLTIKKFETSDTQLKVGENTVYITVPSATWYEFTPEADGNYQFSSKTILGGGICVNTEKINNSMQGISYSPIFALSANTTYYVYLNYSPNAYDLTIEQLNTTLEVGTNAFEVQSPLVWYEFTPTETGSYQFSSTDLEGGSIYVVKNKNATDDSRYIPHAPVYELTADTIYYVAASYIPGTYSLTIKKFDTKLEVGTNAFEVKSPLVWYEFTPTEAGSYQFSSTDLQGGSLYVVKDKNAIDESRYITYAPVYELIADTIYYVAISYTPGTYSLTIKKLDTKLEVGTNAFEVSVPRVWYEFTPTETGSYQFSSTQLTAGNLYVNTTKTESDYTDITTSPTYDLDAAITYYVAVNYTPGSYDLTITRLNNTPTAMEAVTASQIYAANGRIVCDGEFRIYDLLGRDVTRLNGSLQGVYVVMTSDAAQTVIVK